MGIDITVMNERMSFEKLQRVAEKRRRDIGEFFPTKGLSSVVELGSIMNDVVSM